LTELKERFKFGKCRAVTYLAERDSFLRLLAHIARAVALIRIERFAKVRELLNAPAVLHVLTVPCVWCGGEEQCE
jgi:hypothetical protein